MRCLNRIGGKPSGPQLELVLSLLMDWRTSLSLITILSSTLSNVISTLTGCFQTGRHDVIPSFISIVKSENVVIICWFYVKNCTCEHMADEIFRVTVPPLWMPLAPKMEVLEPPCPSDALIKNLLNPLMYKVAKMVS